MVRGGWGRATAALGAAVLLWTVTAPAVAGDRGDDDRIIVSGGGGGASDVRIGDGSSGSGSGSGWSGSGSAANAPVPLGTAGTWTVVPGQVIPFTADGRAYTLAMQGDGNLVQYDTARSAAVWSTGTWGSPGASARLTADGRLEVTGAGGQQLWRSATAGGPGATLTAGTEGSLLISDAQGRGWWMSSTSGSFATLLLPPGTAVSVTHHQLVMQTDGNLVWSDRAGRPLWATGTSGHRAITARFTDGRITLRDPTAALLWASSNTATPGNALGLQGDGNIVIYDRAGRPVWASGSAG
ncbi:hypothetical protein ACIRBX_15675 [Kitasatospora sp. NPDC096147]|uniref:hypothetical protein n=1 Tax=Kitasatospora sp. NPDC096147 TaxID=3364093 RepID=UPI00382D593D